MRFTNYRRAVDYLIHEMPKSQNLRLKDSASLEHSRAILAALGDPQDAHPSVHVAATSGKGTICYLLDAILRAHSQRTGLLVSPHVYDIRERIQINGQLISEKEFTRTLAHVLQVTHPLQPSYFEVLLSLGFVATSRHKVNYLMVETGLGGRWDTTNSISRPDKLCILGQIGLDHTAVLGKTLPEIAAQKAGIIQANNQVIALRQTDDVNHIFEAAAQAKNATITWVDRDEDYQITNDRLAVAAAQALAQRDGWQFEEDLAAATLQQAFIPGRFEKRHLKDHLLVLDGAHNPQKLRALTSRLLRENKTPATFVLAIGERQDIAQCLEILKPVAARVIATEYFTKEQDIPRRPIPAHELADQAEQLGITIQVANTPAQALQQATQFTEPIVATGSFYLVGEIDRSM